MCLASVARNELPGVRPSRPQQHPQGRAPRTAPTLVAGVRCCARDGRTPSVSGCASVRNVQAERQDTCRYAKHIQRFNAGLDAKSSPVPQGRLRSNSTPYPSAVPSGLVCHAESVPALKRRAILKLSLRDKGRTGDRSRSAKQSRLAWTPWRATAYPRQP